MFYLLPLHSKMVYTRFPPVSNDGQGVDIDYNGWHSHERRIETVEHTAMARQDGAAVFYSQRAFEQALYKVAQSTEYYYRKTKAEPSC